MKASIQENKNLVIFRLEGQLTDDSCSHLREKVSEMMGSAGKSLVFDMTGVRFMDSAGLELLLWIRDYCRMSVVQFRLAGLNQLCTKILEITRLDAEFHCGEGITEAVSSLA